jgi:hypothetical protein
MIPILVCFNSDDIYINLGNKKRNLRRFLCEKTNQILNRSLSLLNME